LVYHERLRVEGAPPTLSLRVGGQNTLDEAGSYVRRIDSSQLKAQGPFRTFNESIEEEAGQPRDGALVGYRGSSFMRKKRPRRTLQYDYA
jgi:hypothetical protein